MRQLFFLATLVLYTTFSFTSDITLKQPASWKVPRPAASAKPSINIKQGLNPRPTMTPAKPMAVKVTSINMPKNNLLKAPTPLKAPSSTVNNSTLSAVYVNQVATKLLMSKKNNEHQNEQSGQSIKKHDDVHDKQRSGQLQQFEQVRNVTAMKVAQEKNLETVSQRLQIQSGNCVSIFTVEQRVLGPKASKENLEKAIIIKADLCKKINKEAAIYSSFKEHAQLLHDHVKKIEQEIAAVKSQIIAIDLHKKTEKLSELEVMTSAVKQLQETQIENQVAEKKVAKELQESKKKKCEDIQESLLLSMANKFLGCMNLHVDCDDQDNRVPEKDDFNKPSAMFQKSSNNSDYINGIAGQHNSAFTGNNDNESTYLDDVQYDGRRCKRFMFLDKNGNQTPGSTIVLVPYDQVDGQASAYFIQQGTVNVIDTRLDRSTTEWKNFEKWCENSARQSREDYHQRSPVSQRQQIDCYFKNGLISQDTAIRMNLQISREQSELLANKVMKQLNSVENPGLVRRICNRCFGKQSLPYTEQEYVQHALIIKQAAQDNPKSQNKTVVYQANKIIKDDMRKTQAMQTERAQANLVKAQAEQVRLEAVKIEEANQLQIHAMQAEEKAQKTQQESIARQRAAQAIITQNTAAPKNNVPITTDEHLKKQSEQTLSQELQAIIAKRKKDSVHLCNMPKKTADDLRHQLTTSYNNDSQQITTEETEMIDFMLDSMVHAKNNMTVELAQAGLQAWSHAQQAQTDEEYAYHVHQSKRHYDLLYYQTSGQSCAQQGRFVKPLHIDAMLKDCAAAIEHDKKYRSLHEDSTDTAHTKRLQKRQQALIESQEQIRTNTLVYREYQMSYTARSFMMANNINYAAFDPVKSTSFQHQLTQENLEIIESSVHIAEQNDFESSIKEFAEKRCNLAVAAQQLNQLAKIEEAAAVTNINHVLSSVDQILYQDQLEAEVWKSVGRGVYKGTARALKKWDDFLMRLGHEPKQTIGKIAQDIKSVGLCLGYAAAELSEHSPYAYQADMQIDLIEDVIDLFNKGMITSRKRRFALRAQRNQAAIESGATALLNASLDVISNMAEKSLEDNVSDVTEFGVDTLITVKATEAVIQLAQLSSKVLLEGGRELLEVIPKDLLDSPVAYMQTTTGELIVVAEKTGEDINIIVSKQIAINRAAKIERGKEFSHEVQQLTKANSTKIETLRAQFEKYYKGDVLLPGLEKIEGVKQIENYRAITKNFTTIEQLTEADVMYLNMCNGLHVHSVEINKIVEKAMLQVIDLEGNIVHIKKFDIYHSFLGEMKPNVMGAAKKGGHMIFSESKAFTHTIEKIVPLDNGYFDISVKHIAADEISGFMPKTQFPLGSTLVENAQIIIDLIQEVKIPYYVYTDPKGKVTLKFLRKCGQEFAIYVKDGIAQFHPISPNAPR